MEWTLDDPGVGDVGVILSFASQMRDTADLAIQTSQKLIALRDNTTDAIWSGGAADEFRNRIGKLPDEFHKLATSYNDGLSTYGAKVNDIAQQVTQAKRQQQYAEADHDQAASQQAAWVPPLDPSTGTPQVGARNPHDEAVQDAPGRMARANNQLEDLAGQRRAADKTVINSLKTAHRAGTKNKSIWQQVLDAASEALKIITIVLIVVALIAICVLAIVQPELIPALLVIGGEIMTGLSATQLAVDGGGKAMGENVSWGELGMDALGGVPGLGEAGAGLKGFKVASKLTEAFPKAAGVLARTTTAVRESSLVNKAYHAVTGAEKLNFIPQGLSKLQFSKAISMMRSSVGFDGELLVQGSRFAYSGKAASDLDFMLRVKPEVFDQLLKDFVAKPSRYERELARAIEVGKINPANLGLTALRRAVDKGLPVDVDLSVIKLGGKFDSGVRKFTGWL
jgi:uncharacterized protein YukE